MRTTSNQPRTIITCDDDKVALTVLNRCAIDAGFDVVAEAASAPELIALVEAHHPDVVMVRHELTGILGADAATELTAQPGHPEVVLASPDPAAAQLAQKVGAFAAVSPMDPQMVIEVLTDLLTQIETGERRTEDDRRRVRERRVEQDWSKVFSQRRSGTDRRAVDRREQQDGP